MEPNELRIISDTGEESNFQVTSLYSEQFMEVFNTLQINRDDCLKDIEAKHQCIKDKLDGYNLKIIDILYHNEISLDEKLEISDKDINCKIDCISNEYNERLNFSHNTLKDLETKIDRFKEIQENIDSLIFDDLLSIQVGITRIDEQIESLGLKDIDILMVIRSLRDELKQEIEELRLTKQGIIKPWYKRLFKK